VKVIQQHNIAVTANIRNFYTATTQALSCY